MANTIERKVVFYRVNDGYDDDGLPVPFDFEKTFKSFKTMAFAKRRVDQRGDPDEKLALWADGPTPGSVRFGRLRYYALPSVADDAGALTELELQAGHGLADQSHMIFYDLEDDKKRYRMTIAAVESNRSAPSVRQLGFYLSKALRDQGFLELNFSPLICAPTIKELQELKDIRMVAMRLESSPELALQLDDKDHKNALKKINLSESHRVEVVVSGEKRRGLGSSWRSRVLGMAKSRPGNLERLLVRGFSEALGRVDLIDVFDDVVVSKRKFITYSDRGKAVSSESAFTQIQAAMEAKQSRVARAAALVLDAREDDE